MSFAQFNGVASNTDLYVNSVNTVSPITYSTVVQTNATAASGTSYDIATFNDVEVGTYLMSVPISISSNSSYFNAGIINVYTPTNEYNLQYSSFETGSGMIIDTKVLSCLISVKQKGTVFADMAYFLIDTSATYSFHPTVDDPALLVKIA